MKVIRRITERLSDVLIWYRDANSSVLTNMAWLLNHRGQADDDQLVLVPVERGFEHGPACGFAEWRR